MTRLIKNYTKILKQGGVVIISTDTVPAIICNGLSDVAVKNIYEIKQRSYSKPIAVLCPNIAMSQKYLEINKASMAVLKAFSPGPITLVLKSQENSKLSKYLNLNRKNIGLRIPNHSFLIDLMVSCGFPLAATSANISNALLSYEAIESNFRNKVNYINIDKSVKIKPHLLYLALLTIAT